MLRLTGITAATMTLAGCGGPDDDDPAADDPVADDPAADDETANGEEETDGEQMDEEETDEEETDGEETDGEETDEEETDEEDEELDDDWEDVDEIQFFATTDGWEGVQPDVIDGEENPTIELQEGNEYDITWENDDGEEHNLEIWDENEELIDEYETDPVEEEGETETLTFEATTDMAWYVCSFHPESMSGEIEVHEEE